MLTEITRLIWSCVYICSLISTIAVACVLFIRIVIGKKRSSLKKNTGNKYIIAFFHPFTNACGGGEKVLFLALSSIEQIARDVKSQIIIYTVEDIDIASIIDKAKERFKFELDSNDIKLVNIRKRYFIDQTSMVRLSLLSQAIGNIISVIEAIFTYPPDIFIDTMGVGFAYPFVKIFCSSTKLISYTHYPFIQTDMLSLARTKFKKYYYKAMIFLYKVIGFFPDLVFANSSWTYDHLRYLWGNLDKIHILFPPCNTSEYSRIPLGTSKKNIIVSFSQFRPEKEQDKQIKAFRILLDENKGVSDPHLILIGNI